MGNTKTAVYDGSWSEYGQVPEPDFNHGSKYGWEEPGKKK
jgi:3-mercaptopyruvate sulfurtransferase SseA